MINTSWSQQYLPFTVLKLKSIETDYNGKVSRNSTYRLRYWNAPPSILRDSATAGRNSTYRLRYWNSQSSTCLKVFISSRNSTYRLRYWNLRTDLTAYFLLSISSQQYLPFTVLKLFCFCFFGHSNHYDRRNSTYRLRYWNPISYKVNYINKIKSQQYLPFTVLKRDSNCFSSLACFHAVATVLTVYGIETH